MEQKFQRLVKPPYLKMRKGNYAQIIVVKAPEIMIAFMCKELQVASEDRKYKSRTLRYFGNGWSPKDKLIEIGGVDYSDNQMKFYFNFQSDSWKLERYEEKLSEKLHSNEFYTLEYEHKTGKVMGRIDKTLYSWDKSEWIYKMKSREDSFNFLSKMADELSLEIW